LFDGNDIRKIMGERAEVNIPVNIKNKKGKRKDRYRQIGKNSKTKM